MTHKKYNDEIIAIFTRDELVKTKYRLVETFIEQGLKRAGFNLNEPITREEETCTLNIKFSKRII